MFNRIKGFLKRVLRRMGLITTLQNVTDHKKISVDDDWYAKIGKWLNLYQSNADYLHDKYKTMFGAKHAKMMMTLNMASMSTKKMASLVFNQKAVIIATPKVDGPHESSPEDYQTPENVFIQQTLKDNHFYTNFERYLEYMFAMGGIALRLYTYQGKVRIRFATADSFYPISSDANGVTECVIASSFTRNNQYYTLLEWHEETDTAYTVSNELYVSPNKEDIGHKTALSSIYPNMAEETVYPKSQYSRPTFIYLKPNLSNNLDIGSPLGVPIYANAVDTLKMLDQAYDLLFDEYRLGRRRITIPDYMVKSKVNSETGKRESYFDPDEEVYQQFHAEAMGDTSRKPEDITMSLRNDEIISGINDLLRLYATQVGFSPGSFTYDAESGQAKTATEVVSENSATYQTKNSHETLIEEAIKNMCITILELAKNDQGVAYSGATDVDVTVNFDDSIAKDRQENANYYSQITGNKPLMPRLEAIKRFNNLTDVEAKQWLDQINADEPDQGDPSSIFGKSESGE